MLIVSLLSALAISLLQGFIEKRSERDAWDTIHKVTKKRSVHDNYNTTTNDVIDVEPIAATKESEPLGRHEV